MWSSEPVVNNELQLFVNSVIVANRTYCGRPVNNGISSNLWLSGYWCMLAWSATNARSLVPLPGLGHWPPLQSALPTRDRVFRNVWKPQWKPQAPRRREKRRRNWKCRRRKKKESSPLCPLNDVPESSTMHANEVNDRPQRWALKVNKVKKRQIEFSVSCFFNKCCVWPS